MGCKLWEEMARSLITICYDKRLIDYWEKNRLIDEYQKQPRKLITIAKTILSTRPEYRICIINCLKANKEDLGQYPIYDYLTKIRAIYITTNIDDYLGKKVGKHNTFYKLNQLSTRALQPGNLFQLHGAIGDFRNVILTIDEYAKRYRNERFRRFLDYIFQDPERKYRILFLGYSVSEMEIIDYLFERHGKEKGGGIEEESRYYMMLPFYSIETKLLEHEINYFKKINISIIPYSISQNDYKQLFNVIKNWEEEINRKPSNFYENIKLIDSVI